MIDFWPVISGQPCVCHIQVVFEGLDPETKTFSLSASTARCMGGRLEPRGLQTLSLRIILDASLLEVFAGSGQVITTRVNRGSPPSPQDSGIDLLSIGGITGVARLNAWELSSIWSSPQVLFLSSCARVVCLCMATIHLLSSGLVHVIFCLQQQPARSTTSV